MRSSEDLLKLIIAEAINGPLQEAVDDPVVIKKTTLRPKLSPAEAERVRQGTETSTPPTVARTYTPSARLVGGLSEKLAGLAPTIGGLYDQFTSVIKDPVYVERQKIVDASRELQRESQKDHNDPVDLLTKKLREGVTLEADQPTSVSAVVIRDILLTQSVLNAIAVNAGPAAKDLLKSAHVSGKILTTDAMNFALSIRTQYTRLARDKAVGLNYESAADVVLRDASQTIRDAVGEIASAATISAGALIETRLSTQAIALSPFMKTIEDGERKIRRTSGSTGPMAAGTEERTFRDSGTGNLTKTRILTSAPIGTGDVLTIPSEQISADEVDEFLPGQIQVLDQARVATFRLVNARGYYYVAQASVLLEMKDKIVEYYKKQNSKQTPKIEEAFDKLSSDLSKHPYGKTGISDVKSAIEDLDSMPAVVLSDDNLSAARKAADALTGDSRLRELCDLVDKQKSVRSVIIDGAIDEIEDNNDVWLASNIAASMGRLVKVLRSALTNEAESYRVQPAAGSSAVQATEAFSDVSSTSSEGKVYLANENLKDAIDVFLQEPTSKASLGSFRSIVSLADEAVKQEDMGVSVAEILDEVTGDFGKNVNELKQEQAKLRSDVFAIIGSSESSKVGAIGRLALKQLETPSIEQNVKRRIKDARDARNEDTPANIFLTKPHAFEGAIQLAAELGGTSVDSFTRYAIPGFGSIAGNPKVKPPTGRSKQAHLQMLEKNVASTDVYLKALGMSFNRSEKLIIPSMIKVNNHLSLGVGRLISDGAEQVVITDRAIASLRAKMPDVAEKIGTGKSINVMHVTVQFPAGSWKIGHQPFETLEKDDFKRRINRLNVLSEQVGQSSARNLSLSLKANLKNELPDNAHDFVDTNNLPEIQKVIRAMITDLDRAREAAKGRGYITKADVINAIKGDVTQDFLTENVSVDDDGNLTLSKIAPSFLDAAASHVFEIRSNRWDDAIPTLTSASNTVLRAKTYAPGRSQDMGLYLPADAIQLSASDREHPDNPFNINRQLINDGVRIDYKTSTTASTQQVNFSLKDLEKGNTLDELKQKQLALCASFQERLNANNILESTVKPGTPRDDGSEGRRYPIAVVVDQSQGEKADSVIKMSGNFNGYYFFDGQDLAGGKYKLVYQMTDAALDPKSNIKKIKIGGSDIKVGSMVYIKAMYEAIGLSTSKGVANTPTPPEIFGVGRVMRIYLEGDETADENDKGFKTLLADVKFRGDQVKLSGKRGSIHSPEITLKRVGCMFLGAVTAGGGFFDPARAIDKDIDSNYAKTIAPAILDTAGWKSPSAQDLKRNTSTPVGGLRVGERYQIVQDGNPMKGVVGKLIGFLPSSQVSSDLDAALSRKGIELSAANALLDASGLDLLEGFQVELDRMIKKLTGSTISDAAVKQIFKKIDDDITQDYVKSPTNASGYASHGTDSDVIGDMTHGAGAWEKMHAAGQAVHPGNGQFLSMSGRSKVEKVNFKSANGLNTLLGCSAILRAILKHGPERQSSAESSYNAERDVMNPGIVDVTRTATSSTPYPSGLHTHEAVYFKDKRGNMRVGSPVGTSFRFKLDNATGLAYTRTLRESMASLLVEVKSSISILRSKIEEAQKSPIHPDNKVIAAAQKILDSLERDVMNPIMNGIDEVSSLGYQEKDADGDVDTTKPVQNTLDAWHSVNRELESLKVKSTVSLENGSDVFKKIKGLYTKIEVEAGRLLGSAPIPTAADLSVNDEGEIDITLRSPQPVRDPAARNLWRSAQRSIVNNMTNTIMKQSVIFVDSNGVPVKAGANEDRIAAHLANSKSMKNIFELHKNNLKGDNPLSWENDILSHPTMLEFIDQDGIRDSIRSPTGSKDQLPGIVTSSKKILLAKDYPKLGTVNVIYDEDYMNAYSSCVERIQREKSFSTASFESAQGDKTLADLLEDLVLTLKSLGKSGFDQLAKQLEEFKKSLRSFIPGLGTRDIARQAAQAEQVLMSVVRSLSVLASTSSLTVVEPPPLVSSSADENVSGTYNNLRKKLKDISLKNERKALAEMKSFPADEGTESIIETMKSLRKAATSDSVQRAIVPIAKLSEAESSELNRLKMGEEIPAALGGLVGVSLRKITS